MNQHFTGRKPAIYTAGSVQRSHIMCAMLDSLGEPPPRSYDYAAAVTLQVHDDWGMLGNDQAGDCTCADSGHQLMLRTANTGKIVVPTVQDIFGMYADLTGFSLGPPITNDNGANEVEVMQYLENKGLLGHFIQGHANLNVQNLKHLKWAVQIYGAARLGIQLPDSAEDQFDNDVPWDVRAGAKSVGGHDVCVVGYEPDGTTTIYWIVSWGRVMPVTEAFLLWTLDDGTRVLEEAHAEASDDLLLATGDTPANYNHAQLISDLQKVAI